jgi:hypothetical protein
MKKFTQRTENILKQGKSALKGQRNLHTRGAAFSPGLTQPLIGTNDQLLNSKYLQQATEIGKIFNPFGMVEVVKLAPDQQAAIDKRDSKKHKAVSELLEHSKPTDKYPPSLKEHSEKTIEAWASQIDERNKKVQHYISDTPNAKTTIKNKGKGLSI